MGAFIKKEYITAVILILAFGFFLFTIDKTSEKAVSYLVGVNFRYEKTAFLKPVYVVTGIITLFVLSMLNKSQNKNTKQKSDAFFWWVCISIAAFFSGWGLHLYFIVETIKNKGSFMALEEQFWKYNCTDFIFVATFLIIAATRIRKTIHYQEEKV